MRVRDERIEQLQGIEQQLHGVIKEQTQCIEQLRDNALADAARDRDNRQQKSTPKKKNTKPIKELLKKEFFAPQNSNL